MDVFQEEITFQKMGQASQADIFFDVVHAARMPYCKAAQK